MKRSKNKKMAASVLPVMVFLRPLLVASLVHYVTPSPNSFAEATMTTTESLSQLTNTETTIDFMVMAATLGADHPVVQETSNVSPSRETSNLGLVINTGAKSLLPQNAVEDDTKLEVTRRVIQMITTSVSLEKTTDSYGPERQTPQHSGESGSNTAITQYEGNGHTHFTVGYTQGADYWGNVSVTQRPESTVTNNDTATPFWTGTEAQQNSSEGETEKNDKITTVTECISACNESVPAQSMETTPIHSTAVQQDLFTTPNSTTAPTEINRAAVTQTNNDNNTVTDGDNHTNISVETVFPTHSTVSPLNSDNATLNGFYIMSDNSTDTNNGSNVLSDLHQSTVLTHTFRPYSTEDTANKANNTDGSGHEENQSLWPNCVTVDSSSEPSQSSKLICFITMWTLGVIASIFCGTTIFLWVRLSLIRKRERPSLARWRDWGGETGTDAESLWVQQGVSLEEKVEFWYANGTTLQADSRRKSEQRTEERRKRDKLKVTQNGLWNQPIVTQEDIAEYWSANRRGKPEERTTEL